MRGVINEAQSSVHLQESQTSHSLRRIVFIISIYNKKIKKKNFSKEKKIKTQKYPKSNAKSNNLIFHSCNQ